MHFKKILIALLILIMAFAPIAIIYNMANNCSVYVIDKGCQLSYVDDYGITHDSAYWMVCRDDAEIMTVVVDARTWHLYSIGEVFFVPNRFIVYEGNVNPIGGIN